MTLELIRLSDYSLEALGNGNGLQNFNLVLTEGAAFSITTDSPDDAHLLLRGIATLVPPKSGQFFYKGQVLDFSDYRNLLSYKRKVAYIGSDATLIVNRSLRDNLMLMRYYFEDLTSTEMSGDVVRLCRAFELEDKLHLKPPQVGPEENRLCVIVRELSKNPEILLIERLRDFLRTEPFEALKGVLRNLIGKNLVLVSFSTDQAFTNEFSQKQILIKKGRVTT
jgi:ABC-type iron transport system FetAB ATPase subunit